MRAGLVLRSARLEDAGTVGALLVDSYARLFPRCYPADILDIALPLMTRANPELLSSGLYHLVETEAGHVVGCGGWSLADPADRKSVV